MNNTDDKPSAEACMSTLQHVCGHYNYATIQNNLGVAYSDLARVRNKEANLEKSIYAYQEALKIHTEKTYPITHRTIKANLEEARSRLR